KFLQLLSTEPCDESPPRLPVWPEGGYPPEVGILLCWPISPCPSHSVFPVSTGEVGLRPAAAAERHARIGPSRQESGEELAGVRKPSACRPRGGTIRPLCFRRAEVSPHAEEQPPAFRFAPRPPEPPAGHSRRALPHPAARTGILRKAESERGSRVGV